MSYSVNQICVGRLRLTEAHITKIIDNKTIKFKTWDYELNGWHSDGSETALNKENFEYMYPGTR